MKRSRLLLVVGLVGLIAVAFGLGAVLVWPKDRQTAVRQWPIVGEWLQKLPGVRDTVEQAVVPADEWEVAGVRKLVMNTGMIWYEVSGRLMEDVMWREEETLLSGKLAVQGHLQSQPIAFLAGALDGTIYLGVEQNGASEFRIRETREAVGYLIEGKKVVLTIIYDPNNPVAKTSALALEGLVVAMRAVPGRATKRKRG